MSIAVLGRSSAAVSLVALSLLTGCSGADSGGPQEDSDGPNKYEQTWGTSYSDTTCAQWLNQMDPQQQFAAAADMLTAARNKGDGGTGVAPDDLINTFSGGVTTACVEPTASLAEIGALLYLTERPRFAP